jgi:hypothetical protein
MHSPAIRAERRTRITALPNFSSTLVREHSSRWLQGGPMGHRNRPLPPPLGCSHSITGMDLRPHRGPVCCDRCQPLEAGPRRKARAHARTMTGNRSTRRKPLKVTIERRDEDFAEAQSQVALVAVRSSVAAARRPGAVPATRRSAPAIALRVRPWRRLRLSRARRRVVAPRELAPSARARPRKRRSRAPARRPALEETENV